MEKKIFESFLKKYESELNDYIHLFDKVNHESTCDNDAEVSKSVS